MRDHNYNNQWKTFAHRMVLSKEVSNQERNNRRKKKWSIPEDDIASDQHGSEEIVKRKPLFVLPSTIQQIIEAKYHMLSKVKDKKTWLDFIGLALTKHHKYLALVHISWALIVIWPRCKVSHHTKHISWMTFFMSCRKGITSSAISTIWTSYFHKNLIWNIQTSQQLISLGSYLHRKDN